MTKVKLTSKLSTKVFIITQIFVLLISITFLYGLHYLLNVQHQKKSNTYFKLGGPVTRAPATLRLELQQPEDDLLVFESNLVVSGKTAPNIEVLIFTETEDLVIRSKTDGSFSTIFKLKEGVNQITTAVFDNNGDRRSEERTVFYSKEKLQ